MEKKPTGGVTQVDFTEQTPEMQIGEPEISELCKKAYSENDNGVSNGFCMNTAPCD